MCNLPKCRPKELPLKLIVQQSEVREQEFDSELVKKTLERMNWSHLITTAKGLGENQLPEQLDVQLMENEEFLRKMHNILFQFQVLEGALVCVECDRHY